MATMCFECSICISPLRLSETEKKEFIHNMYIDDNGKIQVDEKEAWNQDIMTAFKEVTSKSAGCLDPNNFIAFCENCHSASIDECRKVWNLINDAVAKHEAIAATKCGHLFHKRCIDKWVAIRRQQKSILSCPYCTQSLSGPNAITTLSPKWEQTGPNAEEPKPTPTKKSQVWTFLKYTLLFVFLFLFVLSLSSR